MWSRDEQQWAGMYELDKPWPDRNMNQNPDEYTASNEELKELGILYDDGTADVNPLPKHKMNGKEFIKQKAKDLRKDVEWAIKEKQDFGFGFIPNDQIPLEQIGKVVTKERIKKVVKGVKQLRK